MSEVIITILFFTQEGIIKPVIISKKILFDRFNAMEKKSIGSKIQVAYHDDRQNNRC